MAQQFRLVNDDDLPRCMIWYPIFIVAFPEYIQSSISGRDSPKIDIRTLGDFQNESLALDESCLAMIAEAAEAAEAVEVSEAEALAAVIPGDPVSFGDGLWNGWLVIEIQLTWLIYVFFLVRL